MARGLQQLGPQFALAHLLRARQTIGPPSRPTDFHRFYFQSQEIVP